jgi:hypothetical protein
MGYGGEAIQNHYRRFNMVIHMKLLLCRFKELVLEAALDRREDHALSAIGEARDHEKVKTVKHEEAWK